MSLVSKFLLSLSRPAWELNCSGFVPSNYENFRLDQKQQLKTVLRYLKRYLYMCARGQRQLLRHFIESDVRKILWINLSAPSLGDALMDLSAVSLLGERRVTLVTHTANIQLFEGDSLFERVLSPSNGVVKGLRIEKFDLVVLDSFSPRTLDIKIKASPSTPFVGIYGFLNGYEVHRTIYAFRRLEKLLGIKSLATTRLRLASDGSHHIRSITRPRLGVGIGGEWEFRTYKHWPIVLANLVSLDLDIILLGSENGLKDAAEIFHLFGDRVMNLVSRTSLKEAIEQLRACDAFLGADGGLWHIASACGLPSVSLHADCQLYDEFGDWHSRAAAEPLCIPLAGNFSVNEIEPQLVVTAVKELLFTPKN